MPRHPPYALHSLSPHTQTQQKHFSDNQQTHPTPKGRTSSRSIRANSYKDARVHYPTTKQPQEHQTTRPPSRSRRLIPQGPTACHPAHPPTTKGQRTTGPTTTTSQPVPHHPGTRAEARTRTAVLDAGHPRWTGSYVDDSTSEHPSAVRANA